MASNFKVWDEGNNHVVNVSEFADDSGQRGTGFQPNTAASSSYVNSGLREGTLFATAFMDAIEAMGVTVSSIDFRSPTSSLVTVINNLFSAIKLSAYPVGSIFISASHSTAQDVATALGGGTWEAWGQGRVPVGVGTTTDAASTSKTFSSPELTGGRFDQLAISHTHSYQKADSFTEGHTLTISEMPSHTHVEYVRVSGGDVIPISSVDIGSSGSSTAHLTAGSMLARSDSVSTGSTGGDGSHTHKVTTSSATSGSTGTSGTDKNLQPYITVYMWKRTA